MVVMLGVMTDMLMVLAVSRSLAGNGAKEPTNIRMLIGDDEEDAAVKKSTLLTSASAIVTNMPMFHGRNSQDNSLTKRILPCAPTSLTSSSSSSPRRTWSPSSASSTESQKQSHAYTAR